MIRVNIKTALEILWFGYGWLNRCAVRLVLIAVFSVDAQATDRLENLYKFPVQLSAHDAPLVSIRLLKGKASVDVRLNGDYFAVFGRGAEFLERLPSGFTGRIRLSSGERARQSQWVLAERFSPRREARLDAVISRWGKLWLHDGCSRLWPSLEHRRADD